MPDQPLPAALLCLAVAVAATPAAARDNTGLSPVVPALPLAPKSSATAPDLPPATGAAPPPLVAVPPPSFRAVAAAMGAANAKPGPRTVPGRVIPLPETVSPQIRALVAAPYPEPRAGMGRTAAELKALVAADAARSAASLPALRDRLGVTSTPTTIAGVKVYIVTAKSVPEAHGGQTILAIHGGGFLLDPGEAGTLEAVLMAGFGRYRVVAVDYRMAPDHPYPAALDDVFAVYKDLLRTTDPRRIGVVGTSAGGGLTLSLCLRAKAEGVPMPGAIAPGTPEADLTNSGDTFMTNAWLDNVLVEPGRLASLTKLYVPAGHDLRDPLLSPLFGDYRGMPPAILTSGTRDLFLSNAVRVHRKLRQAGVDAKLQLFEAQSHSQYLGSADAPETKEAFAEITRFFDAHLAR